MSRNYDFSGWATVNDLKCSDGRIIGSNAFADNDGETVPLVWNHQHGGVSNVLGHALLENRKEGVYAYCSLNNTAAGKDAKEAVEHGDICSLSIYANKLQQQGPKVIHGAIREVSLVLAGANPGAFIDTVIRHGEYSDEEAVIFTGEEISLRHAEEKENKEKESKSMNEKETEKKDDNLTENKDETVGDVLDTLTDKQRKVVEGLIGNIINDLKKEKEGDSEEMKHNVFDSENNENENVLSHSEIESIIGDAKRYGSLKESVIAHGIDDIEYLFPEAKTVNPTPDFIKRDTGWVSDVMNSVHHTPFSRVKSIFANITEDEARARGYIKGKQKKEEVFGLLKRSTTPQTIYKKQKLDRDDVIDITDFDVIAWLKSEMRTMLDEELARAFLIGDGREASSDDKINPLNIRPIWTDDDLYTVKYTIATDAGKTADAKAKAFIRGAIKSRKNYKGSGNPVLFTTEDVLTDCLLLEDTTGRVIYDTEEKLRTALRVSKIVTVEVMEGASRSVDGNTHDLMGIIVNLSDYNVGADKGGAVNMFDDFDIDYNAQKYLIETRCSGALIKPYSAIAIEYNAGKATSEVSAG